MLLLLKTDNQFSKTNFPLNNPNFQQKPISIKSVCLNKIINQHTFDKLDQMENQTNIQGDEVRQQSI